MIDPDFRFEMGAPWLDLPATLSGRLRPEKFDRLSDPARLGDWLAAVGLDPRAAPDETDLEAARTLREAIHAVARAIAEDRTVPPSAGRALNAALAFDDAPTVTVRNGALAASRPANTLAALGRLARQATDGLTGSAHPHLRTCGDDTCSGVFFDGTGRRRWCNDSRCGSRARVRAHRERARSSTQSR